MVTTRILTQRRIVAAAGEPAVRRRRSQPAARPNLDTRGVLARLRLGAFGRIYLAAGLLLAGLTLYLVQAAHVTQASYEIQRLKAQQSDLAGERDQLRYREASLKAPARVEQEAQQAGMQRIAPNRYLPYQAVNLNLSSPQRLQQDASSPVMRALAAVARAVGISREAMASER